MIVPALIAGAGLAGWIAGRRSMRRALQTTDGRMRHRIPVREARTPTAPLAVVHQLHPAPATRPMRSQRGRRIHA